MEKEERNKQINDWKRKNVRRVLLEISKEQEQDILEKLESQKSMNAYIKDLIRQDIAKDKEKR
mgnify:FL=1